MEHQNFKYCLVNQEKIRRENLQNSLFSIKSKVNFKSGPSRKRRTLATQTFFIVKLAIGGVTFHLVMLGQFMLYSSWNLVLLLTQFLAAVLILYPLKTPENLKTNGFLAFSGVRKQQYLSKTNQVRS